MTRRHCLRTHGIVTVWVILSLAGNARSDPRDGSSAAISTFKNGEYSVPIGSSAEPSSHMTQKAITFLRAMALQDDAQLQKQQAVDAELWDPAYGSHRSWLEWQDMMVLCQACLNTEAALTVVLIFADKASRWEKGKVSLKPIETALNRLIMAFPDSWQAQAAPLLLARFQIRGSTESGGAKYLQAVGIVKERLAELTDAAPAPGEEQKLAAMSGIEFPLRVSYLKGIAACYYQAATSGQPISLDALQSAEDACRKLIREYPATKDAVWAKDIAERRIPKLRELAGEQQ